MIISIANNKGGTGKTTTAVNLGAALAENEQRILEVDLDPQGNLSVNLGVDIDNLESTIYDVLLNPESYPLDGVIISDLSNDMKLIPANIDLSGATVELMDEMSRETILKRALSPVLKLYDFCLIDCPPNLGLLTLSSPTTKRLMERSYRRRPRYRPSTNRVSGYEFTDAKGLRQPLSSMITPSFLFNRKSFHLQ